MGLECRRPQTVFSTLGTSTSFVDTSGRLRTAIVQGSKIQNGSKWLQLWLGFRVSQFFYSKSRKPRPLATGSCEMFWAFIEFETTCSPPNLTLSWRTLLLSSMVFIMFWGSRDQTTGDQLPATFAGTSAVNATASFCQKWWLQAPQMPSCKEFSMGPSMRHQNGAPFCPPNWGILWAIHFGKRVSN